MIVNEIQINASLEDILAELQSQLAINNIPYLTKYKDSGNDIMVQCPYHGMGQERKPSAGIRKTDGTFHCFACGETHTLPEVISHCFGYTNDILGKQGFKWIMKNFATVQVDSRQAVKLNLSRHKKHKDNQIKYVPEEELDSYRYYHEYWKKRGITDTAIIELFDLGYDVKNNCITFPNRDIDGNCIFVAKRNVKTKWFNYPKGVDKPLYGLYELWQVLKQNIKVKELFITESMIDSILIWQSGQYALALNGTGSELQYKQLNQLPVRKYILATDNDEAGMRARGKLRKEIRNKLITELNYPPTIKDIGDLGVAGRFDDIKDLKKWEIF